MFYGIRDPETNREFTGTEAEILKAIEIYKAHGRPRVLIYRSTRPPKSLKDDPVANGIDLSLLERVIPTGDGLLMLGDNYYCDPRQLLQCGSKS